jgi:hypothetical protein
VNNQYFAKTIDARVDHRFSDKDSMFGRFTYNPTTTVYQLCIRKKVGSIRNPGTAFIRGLD